MSTTPTVQEIAAVWMREELKWCADEYYLTPDQLEADTAQLTAAYIDYIGCDDLNVESVFSATAKSVIEQYRA